ncbi:MAG: Hsp20/alpha crystallin family protein [Candidatus Omnitrophota bacterium]
MNKGKRKTKNEKQDLDLDFGIGKLSLGGLFRGIEKLVDLAGDLKEAGGEVKKEGEIDLGRLKEGMKGVFGFSVKTAMGGKTVVEPFGNVKKTPKGPKVEEEREPIVDIFNEKDEVVVMAEMPGVKQEAISLDLKEDILEIKAVSKDRKYRKEVLLPAKVQAKTLTSNYRNGILEIRVQK